MSQAKGSGKISYCSFCTKSEHEVRKLIAGPDVFICDECIELCNDIIDEQEAPNEGRRGEQLTPDEIFSELNKYVIGQDAAKKVLSNAVYEHYKRLRHNFGKSPDVEIAKSNILLLGPTGSGKTLLAQTLARSLQVPFAVQDATTLTEAGYVGEDVEGIIQKLLQSSGNDVAKAQQGIVYIDEVDKIARKLEARVVRDVSGEGVQRGLLRLIEGTMVSVPLEGKKRGVNSEVVSVDTTNILFICGGAFDGLARLIDLHRESAGIGFRANPRNLQNSKDLGKLLKSVSPEDLVRYGLLPEFVGRLPIIAVLEELGVAALVEILTEPKNSLIRQQQALFAMEGVELEFTKEALELIARKAVVRGSGARGLRSIVEEVLGETKFNLPRLVRDKKASKKIVVEKECVEGGKPPEW